VTPDVYSHAAVIGTFVSAAKAGNYTLRSRRQGVNMKKMNFPVRFFKKIPERLDITVGNNNRSLEMRSRTDGRDFGTGGKLELTVITKEFLISLSR
jgi:hypothetical protein